MVFVRSKRDEDLLLKKLGCYVMGFDVVVVVRGNQALEDTYHYWWMGFCGGCY